jgi:hypothetical protein
VRARHGGGGLGRRREGSGRFRVLGSERL